MSKELDWMTSNIQDSILNSFEPNPQSQARNKAPNRAPQNPGSKAPIGPFREHDLYMPIANVVRNIRRGLPPNAKVSDEAKEMVQECVSEFISFVTSEANDGCKTEHRKTITAEDIIGAMSRLGFEDYVQPLKLYLHKYRESMMLPSVPKRGVGNKSTEASAVIPITDLPPAVHPQSDKFRAAVTSSGSFGDGSGTSTGPITMGRGVDTGTIWDGSGPSLALGIGAGPGGNERGGPSGSPQAELEFNDFNGINE